MLPVTITSKEAGENCPIRQVLSKVTGKWQMLIVLCLEDGALRFGELKRAIGEITQRVLTENLRSLERDGFLTRTVNPGPPVAVSYALTPQGEAWLQHLRTIVIYAARTFDDVKASRAAYDKRLAG